MERTNVRKATKLNKQRKLEVKQRKKKTNNKEREKERKRPSDGKQGKYQPVIAGGSKVMNPINQSAPLSVGIHESCDQH